MKTLAIVLITALISSAGTFFYTTKQMDPSFYRQVVNKARGHISAIRAPASDCSSGQVSLSDRGNSEKPNIKILMQKMKKAQQERKEFLKQFEESGNQRANH